MWHVTRVESSSQPSDFLLHVYKVSKVTFIICNSWESEYMLCTIHISNAWNYLWYYENIWRCTALSRSEYLFLLAYLHIKSWDKREKNEMKWNTGKLLITKTLRLPLSEGEKHLISIPQIFHQHSTLHEPLLVYKISLAELFTSCEARRRENSSATVPLCCAVLFFCFGEVRLQLHPSVSTWPKYRSTTTPSTAMLFRLQMNLRPSNLY